MDIRKLRGKIKMLQLRWAIWQIEIYGGVKYGYIFHNGE